MKCCMCGHRQRVKNSLKKQNENYKIQGMEQKGEENNDGCAIYVRWTRRIF